MIQDVLQELLLPEDYILWEYEMHTRRVLCRLLVHLGSQPEADL